MPRRALRLTSLPLKGCTTPPGTPPVPDPKHPLEPRMKYVNLTPHPVTVIRNGRTVLEVPPSGDVARIEEKASSPMQAQLLGLINKHGYYDDTDENFIVDEGDETNVIPVVTMWLGEIKNLPDPDGETLYVVSMPLAMGLKAAGIYREDCVYPYPQVRDGSGRIIGCGGFAKLPSKKQDQVRL